MYTYSPIGVCSKKITFDILNNKVVKVNFLGGCDGNLKGLSSLIEGMDIDDAIKRLQGITCALKILPVQINCLKLYKKQKKQNKESI